MKKLAFIDHVKNDFTTSKYIYQTNQSLEVIREKIEFVINPKEIFNFKYNLSGSLQKDNSFKLTRRAGFISIDSWDREPVTITGVIKESQSAKTIVEVEVKPNAIFLLFAFLLGLLGLWFMISALFTGNWELFFAGMFFLFLIPTAMWALASYTKRYYKSEFEKALNLRERDVLIG